MAFLYSSLLGDLSKEFFNCDLTTERDATENGDDAGIVLLAIERDIVIVKLDKRLFWETE